MKKNIISVVLLVISFIFISCSNDEIIYSCDKSTNEHIKKNLTYYSSMTRDEWLKLPDSLKNPVYLTFSPERMYMFWLQKRDELLSLEWNELEKNILIFYMII